MKEDVPWRRGSFIQNQIVRPVREDTNAGREQQLLHLVSGKPGTVDDYGAGEALLRRFYNIIPALPPKGGHRAVQPQLTAIFYCALTGGNAQLPGVHGAGAGGVQGGAYALFQPRLQFLCLLSAQKLQGGHAVFPPLFQFVPQNPISRRSVAEHQGAAAPEGHFQVLAEPGESGIGPDGHPGLQAAGPVVIARINDGGVGSGNAGAYISRPFQQQGGQLPAAEAPGGKAAQNPRANHHRVIVLHPWISMISPGRSRV